MFVKSLMGMAVAVLFVTSAVAGEYRLVPPDMSFHPLTATDAELTAHNLPPHPGKDAPKDVVDLWEKSLALYHKGTKEGKFEGLRFPDGKKVPSQYAPIYENNSINAGVTVRTPTSFTSGSFSQTSFYVPYMGPRHCGSAETFSWWSAFNGTGFWQAGMLFTNQTNASCQQIHYSYTPFTEAIPGQLPQPIPGVTALPGNLISIYLYFGSQANPCVYYSNVSRAQTATVCYTGWSGAFAGNEMNWLSETQPTYTAPHTGNTGFGAYAKDQTGKVYGPGYYTNSNVYYETMVRNGVNIMWPTGISAGQFTLNNSQ